VLDIAPNGEKYCLIPDMEYGTVTPAECQLKPLQSIEFPDESKSPGFVIEGTPGKETLKLILTHEEWWVCETIQSRGAGSRGPGDMNPLDILLDQTFKLETTRAKPLVAPSGGAGIYSFTYNIVGE